MIPLAQNCAMYGGGPQLFYEMPGTDGNLGRLSAYETNTMRPVWSFQQRSPFLTGVVSTAGGVGFVGDFDRVFRGFDVKTGKTLWETRLPRRQPGTPLRSAWAANSSWRLPPVTTAAVPRESHRRCYAARFSGR